MNHSIQNDFFIATVSTTGAELQSLRSKKTGLEYIWNGDAAYWSGRAPILFPILCSLKDGRYTYKGKEYQMPKHGYIRNAELVHKSVSPAGEVMSFTCGDTEETRKIYPFSYELEIIFRLEANTLYVDYIVKNKSVDEMYFSIGAHEAFNCPRREGESFDDYYLVFEQAEHPWEKLTLDVQKGLLDGGTAPVFEGDTLPLKHSLFEDDALIFKNIGSKKLWIKSNKSDEIVEACYDGAANLGIWTSPNAPFICIEPWCGLPDYTDSTGDITKKDSIVRLEGKEVFTFTHSFTITE